MSLTSLDLPFPHRLILSWMLCHLVAFVWDKIDPRRSLSTKAPTVFTVLLVIYLSRHLDFVHFIILVKSDLT